MDVVVETNVVFSALHAFLRHRSVAGTWMVEAPTEVEQRVHRGHMAVRTVVGGAFAVDVASGEDAREIFLGDGNGGVGLVVFEEHVVAGAVLLDEGVFEQKRISAASWVISSRSRRATSRVLPLRISRQASMLAI